MEKDDEFDKYCVKFLSFSRDLLPGTEHLEERTFREARQSLKLHDIEGDPQKNNNQNHLSENWTMISTPIQMCFKK